MGHNFIRAATISAPDIGDLDTMPVPIDIAVSPSNDKMQCIAIMDSNAASPEIKSPPVCGWQTGGVCGGQGEGFGGQGEGCAEGRGGVCGGEREGCVDGRLEVVWRAG